MKSSIILGAIGLALTVAAPTGARAAEWCARNDPYTENCGFHTFQQCLDTVRGEGGICVRNPRAYERGPSYDDRAPYRER